MRAVWQKVAFPTHRIERTSVIVDWGKGCCESGVQEVFLFKTLDQEHERDCWKGEVAAVAWIR
jgi:hypothetical protein